MKQLIVPMKNDIIQYKRPMIGQFTFKLTNGKIYTGLLLVICIVYFFIWTIRCFLLVYRQYDNVRADLVNPTKKRDTRAKNN